jgi:hypothetical protein
MPNDNGNTGHVIEPRNSWTRVSYAMQAGTLNIMNQGDTTLWLRIDDERGSDVGMIRYELTTGQLVAGNPQTDSEVEPPQAFDSGAVIKVGYGAWLSDVRIGDHTLTTKWFSNKGPLVYVRNAAGKEVARGYFDFVGGKVWQLSDR